MMRQIPPLLLKSGLHYQWSHPWQALLALIGISMGVAVVLAVDLANGAAKASFALSTEQLRGAATHRLIGSSAELPQSVYTKLFTTPGHPPMAPVIDVQVRVENQSARFRLLGLDIFAEAGFRSDLNSSIRGESSLGEWLSNPRAVALSQKAAEQLGITLNQQLKISSRGESFTLEVIAISPQTSVASRDLLVVDMATAQSISGMQGKLSHIDLILDNESISWLQQQLPAGVKLVDIDQQTEGIVGLSASFELNLTAMSLLALLVGVFLIFNAMSFSIVQRRNLLGRLRSLGVHTQELYSIILAEAFVLGIIGTLIGCVLGIWLGQGLTRIVAVTVSELYFNVSADALHINPLSLLKAILLGLGGTLVAAWFPASQAAKTPPLTTLSRSALESETQRQLPRLLIIGIFMQIIGLLVAFAVPGGVVMGFAGLFIFLLGAALITPVGLPLAHWLLDKLPLKGIALMVVRDLDRHLSRLGTALAALMVALAASVGVAVMVDSMRSSVGDWLQDLLSADLYIAAQGFEDGALLPTEVVERAPLMESVESFSMYRTRKLTVQNAPLRLVASRLAQKSRQGFEFIQSAESDPWQGFDAGNLIISEPLAFRLKLKPSDFINLPTPSGEKKYRIAAVFRDYASEHGRLFMNLAHYQKTWSDQAIDTISLFSSHTKSDQLYAQANDQFNDQYDLVYTEAGEIYKESMAVFDRTFRITEVLRILSVMVAFIGILSALMAVQLERRKEFAVLRALGLTPRQVSLLIMMESLILGLLAAIFAIPVGLAMAWVLTDAIQLRAFGWSMPFTVSADPLWMTLILGLVAASLASLYPAWQASRHDPAPQLRED